MKAVQKQTRTLGGWVKKNSAQFRGMGLAITAMGAAALLTFKKMVKQYVEVGDMIHKMALRTGFAATTLSELAYAADISGADITMLEKGVKKMAKTISDADRGMATYIDAFKAIGFEVKDLINLSPEDQFMKIGLAIADVENPTLRAAAAVDIFGRAGTMLLPLFAEGSEGIKNLSKDAHTLGIIFDEEMAAKAAKLKDAQTALKGSVQGLSIAILNDLIPVLTDVTKGFTDFFVTSRKDASSWADAILGFFKLMATGIEGLALAWHAMQVIVFKGAEFIVKAIQFQIDALTAPLRLLAKLPGYGIVAKKMLKVVGKHTADLTTISDGYNKAAAEQIEKITDLVIGFDKFKAGLDKISEGLKEGKKEIKDVGTAAKETTPVFISWASAIGIIFQGVLDNITRVGRGMSDILGKAVVNMESDFFGFEESTKAGFWKMYQDASRFTSALSGLFNQMTENRMASIDKEYEARKTAIDKSLMTEKSKTDAMTKLDAEFDKKRKKAQRAAAIRTKAMGIMESIIHTAGAVAEALPNIPLAIAVGIMGAIQTALIAGQAIPALAKGGRLGKGEAGIVGERGAEVFVPDAAGTIVPIRERAGGVALGPTININTQLNISTIDGLTTRDFMRSQGLREIVEAIRVGIMKPEFQVALGVK